VVIGWDIQRQSCLVDRYSIKQWPAFGRHTAFDNIDPGNRITDFDVIEEAVICASYPMQSNPQREAAGLPPLFLPVARVSVNSAGQPGATNNARVWTANMLGRTDPGMRRIEQYRVLLMQGSSSRTGEAYPKPKQVTHDDQGKALLTPVYERYPNVHDLKKIIAKRMKIETPGPGRMHLPSNLPMRYVNELTAEQLQNGEWVKVRDRNETWDGWVACELTRASLEPDRPSLWEDASGNPRRPPWATPKPRGQGLESVVSPPSDPFDRLSKLNRGD
jgi:phage terminase large subunit GpA-like protein